MATTGGGDGSGTGASETAGATATAGSSGIAGATLTAGAVGVSFGGKSFSMTASSSFIAASAAALVRFSLISASLLRLSSATSFWRRVYAGGSHSGASGLFSFELPFSSCAKIQ
eukprot:3969311-Prymnesium_polylepis.1